MFQKNPTGTRTKRNATGPRICASCPKSSSSGWSASTGGERSWSMRVRGGWRLQSWRSGGLSHVSFLPEGTNYKLLRGWVEGLGDNLLTSRLRLPVTVLYAVLFLEWDEKDLRGNPFHGVRTYIFDGINNIFTRPTAPKNQADTPPTAEA